MRRSVPYELLQRQDGALMISIHHEKGLHSPYAAEFKRGGLELLCRSGGSVFLESFPSVQGEILRHRGNVLVAELSKDGICNDFFIPVKT